MAVVGLFLCVFINVWSAVVAFFFGRGGCLCVRWRFVSIVPAVIYGYLVYCIDVIHRW